MAGQRPLEPYVEVRILPRERIMQQIKINGKKKSNKVFGLRVKREIS